MGLIRVGLGGWCLLNPSALPRPNVCLCRTPLDYGGLPPSKGANISSPTTTTAPPESICGTHPICMCMTLSLHVLPIMKTGKEILSNWSLTRWHAFKVWSCPQPNEMNLWKTRVQMKKIKQLCWFICMDQLYTVILKQIQVWFKGTLVSFLAYFVCSTNR